MDQNNRKIEGTVLVNMNNNNTDNYNNNNNNGGGTGGGFTRPPEMNPVPTTWNDMTDEEKKVRATGLCCFNLLGLVATAAFICSVYAFAQCDYLERQVTIGSEYTADDLTQACDNLGYSSMGVGGEEICTSLLQDHGIGYYYWQATIPVDQRVCVTYTMVTPWGVVTPTFDSAFNASRWFSIIGYVFGGAAWLTLTCSSCCRMDQSRLKGTACYFWIACFFTGMSLIMFNSNVCQKDFFEPYFIPPSQQNNATLVAMYNSVIEDVSCGLSLGSKMAISATVLYAVCSCMVPFSIVPFYEPRYYQHEFNNDNVQQQQPQQPSGPQPERGPSVPYGQGPVVQGQSVDAV